MKHAAAISGARTVVIWCDEAALLETQGVTDAYVWSNRTRETVTIGTTLYPVKPHSVFICVNGGNDTDIAETIFQYYNPGADMNGDTTFTVYDKENYSPPYPQYVMQCSEPPH
ncbi:hypothetical protein [Candidatus Arsenophonus triatominarum]|uniref:hypothetical protein n=1 Tax=Candidatus Arsenophonus triatominarum TaxID=57911 RepID=UPI0007C497BC|nr:hypothetical protein [Candidatus Arsenophonus triatominarum]